MSTECETNESRLLWRSRDRRFAAEMEPDTLNSLLRIAREACPAETGGVLVGYYTADLCTAVVTELLEPSSDSLSAIGRFVRGVAGLARALAQRWHKRRRTYYVGEWHSHPGGDAFPSGADTQAMHGIAGSAEEQCPEPILVIAGGALAEPSDVRVWVYTREGDIVRMRPDVCQKD